MLLLHHLNREREIARERIGRWTLAAATAAALGFGATRALASPAEAKAAAACESEQCTEDCRLAGYTGGYCIPGRCVCRA